jgi:hypothetical protein
MTLTALEIRRVLCYDRFRESEYSPGKRIAIHQYLAGQAPLPDHLVNKLLKDHYKIKKSGWEVPEMRYDNDRSLIYYCNKENFFKPLTLFKR